MLLFILLLLHTSAVLCGKPNIVFILTDDQDVELGGLTPLEKTKELIAGKGVTFTNAFATTPICCPSRASILTGLYLHNHETYNNSLNGGCSDGNWQNNFETKSYASYLKNEGYATFYAGKYLNQYGHKQAGGTEHVPPGWDWWVGLVGNSVYYNYTLSVNGSKLRKGDGEDDYLTDVLKKYGLDFLNQKSVLNNGFLMVISTPSAHDPFTPAVRHQNKFLGVKAPRLPNFNIPPGKEKHWLLRLPPGVLPEGTVNLIDSTFRHRWETLLSVDELVESVILKLEDLGVLNDTFVIFASDHGFHLGQFGLPWDKRQPYDFDLKIPFLVRGPGIPEDVKIPHPILTIDIAPTILDMANVSSKPKMDGQSLLPKLKNPGGDPPDRLFLIEYRGEQSEPKYEENCYEDVNVKLCAKELSCKCFDSKNNTFACIRRFKDDVNEIFCKFEDDERFTEFYDLKSDPYQLHNLAFGGERRIDSNDDEILKCCKEKAKEKKSIDDCFKI